MRTNTNALFLSFAVLFGLSAQATTVAHTLAMIADFDILTQSCSKAQIESLLFGPRSPKLSLADHFLDISDERFTIDGDVINGLVLNTTGQTDCFYTITEVANAEATAQGIDLSLYDHLMYFIPKPPACVLAGWSTIGGAPSESVSFLCGNDAVALHEFSHGQFSLHHSGQRNNPDPYADHSCPMGQGYHPYNAAWMHQLGYKISETLNATGDYVLSPLDIPEAGASDPQIYAINTTLGTVFLSTRVNTIGRDAHEPANLAGINIHFHASEIVDTVQETVLSTGDFYCNQNYGFCVNQISKDASSTVFHIEMHEPGSSYWAGPSASRTPSLTATSAPSRTRSPSLTRSPTASLSPSRSASLSPLPTPSHTQTGSHTPSPSFSATPSQTIEPTPSQTPHAAHSSAASSSISFVIFVASLLLAS